jgi:hypothetical protein
LTADGRKRRKDRPIAPGIQQARFRDPDRTPDAFDLDLNQRMNWALIHDLATARFILQRGGRPPTHSARLVLTNNAMAVLLASVGGFLVFATIVMFSIMLADVLKR